MAPAMKSATTASTGVLADDGGAAGMDKPAAKQPDAKPAAKDAAALTLTGMKIKIAGTSASALETLRYTTSPTAVAALDTRVHLVDAAYEAFLADVRARIDTI